MNRAAFYKTFRSAPGAPSSQSPDMGPSLRCPGPVGGGACPNTRRDRRCEAGAACPIFGHSVSEATPPRRRLAFVGSRQVVDRNGRIADLARFDTRTLFDKTLRESHRTRTPVGTITALRIADVGGVLTLLGEAEFDTGPLAVEALKRIAAASARGERRGVSLEWMINHTTGLSYLETVCLVDEPAVPGAGVVACLVPAGATRAVASAVSSVVSSRAFHQELRAELRAAFAAAFRR